MGSVGFLRGAASSYANTLWHTSRCFSIFPTVTVSVHQKLLKFRSFSSTTTRSSLQPPDVPRLAKTARISLTPNEVEEFAPKIQQVIDWFGQLQSVDLQSVEPSIRAETENNLRDNTPETFDQRDAIITSIPSYEEHYIKVPRVLSMD